MAAVAELSDEELTALSLYVAHVRSTLQCVVFHSLVLCLLEQRVTAALIECTTMHVLTSRAHYGRALLCQTAAASVLCMCTIVYAI
jgi:hypothetical protein